MRKGLIAILTAGVLVLAGGIALYKTDTSGAGRTTKEVSAKTAS